MMMMLTIMLDVDVDATISPLFTIDDDAVDVTMPLFCLDADGHFHYLLMMLTPYFAADVYAADLRHDVFYYFA